MKKLVSTILVFTLLIFNSINVLADGNKTSVTNVIAQVQLSGEVKKPGVYAVPSGTRLAEVIQKAGGLKPDAVVTGINLTLPVQDGISLNIPSKKEVAKLPVLELPKQQVTNPPQPVKTQQNISPSRSAVTSGKKLVNLNTATQEELESLPGVGEKTAKNIISYRNRNKGFKNIHELKNIDRLGNKRFMKLKSLVAI